MGICHRALQSLFNRALRKNFPPTLMLKRALRSGSSSESIPSFPWLCPFMKWGEGGMGHVLWMPALCKTVTRWLGRKEVNRALEQPRIGYSNKGSLWSGQQRVCCHLLKTVRLGLQGPSHRGGRNKEPVSALLSHHPRANLRPLVDTRIQKTSWSRYLMVQNRKLVTPKEWE